MFDRQNGVTKVKREGDRATPRGPLKIVGCYYRPDRMIKPNNWALPIRCGDLWSDDPIDSNYNRHVRIPHSYSHESMRRGDRLYDLVLTTDWNWPLATPGDGSAIFLHRWRKPRHPTEGCIALHPQHLLQIAKRISPDTSLLIP